MLCSNISKIDSSFRTAIGIIFSYEYFYQGYTCEYLDSKISSTKYYLTEPYYMEVSTPDEPVLFSRPLFNSNK